MFGKYPSRSSAAGVAAAEALTPPAGVAGVSRREQAESARAAMTARIRVARRREVAGRCMQGFLGVREGRAGPRGRRRALRAKTRGAEAGRQRQNSSKA